MFSTNPIEITSREIVQLIRRQRSGGAFLSDPLHIVFGMDGAVVDDAMNALRAGVDRVLALDCDTVPALKLAGVLTGLEVQRSSGRRRWWI